VNCDGRNVAGTFTATTISVVAVMPVGEESGKEKINTRCLLRVIITFRNIKVDDILPKLNKEGFRVDSVLEEIGVITGEIDKENLTTLAHIECITVEPEQSVQLPTPDLPLQ